MKKIYYFLILAVIYISGCEDKPEYPFSGGAQIYFDRSGGMGISDSLVYSFAVRDKELTEATLEVPIIITGNTKSYDREISIDLKDSSKYDKNYTIEKAVLPANKNQCNLKIHITKTPELKNEERVLEFTLLENEHFSTSMDTVWWDYKVKFNDILSKPDRWVYDCQPTFGKYSRVKYEFIIKVTGRWDFSKTGDNPVTDGELNYYLDKCKSALAKYEKDNGDLLDENGIKVTF